jgi:ribosomal protein S21
MGKKGAHAVVTSKECRGNHERMIRKFIKKVKRQRIIEQVRERKYFKSKGEKRKEKHLRAERQRKKDARKRVRAQERRFRKK